MGTDVLSGAHGHVVAASGARACDRMLKGLAGDADARLPDDLEALVKSVSALVPSAAFSRLLIPESNGPVVVVFVLDHEL